MLLIHIFQDGHLASRDCEQHCHEALHNRQRDDEMRCIQRELCVHKVGQNYVYCIHDVDLLILFVNLLAHDKDHVMIFEEFASPPVADIKRFIRYALQCNEYKDVKAILQAFHSKVLCKRNEDAMFY